MSTPAPKEAPVQLLLCNTSYPWWTTLPLVLLWEQSLCSTYRTVYSRTTEPAALSQSVKYIQRVWIFIWGVWRVIKHIIINVCIILIRINLACHSNYDTLMLRTLGWSSRCTVICTVMRTGSKEWELGVVAAVCRDIKSNLLSSLSVLHTVKLILGRSVFRKTALHSILLISAIQ